MVDASLQELQKLIVQGDHRQAPVLTGQLIEAGVSPAHLLHEGLIAGMREVGERFQCGEYFVPEMRIAARALKAALEVLRPTLAATGARPVGTIVLGTVRGDLHDIGKNLTSMLLEGAGLQVIDLGVDVAAERFVAAVRQHNANLVGMSALLTTTMPYMAEVMRALEATNLRQQVKVIIGGAPVTESWAQQIGADAFALDAASGAERCRALLRQ
jgi:5-methyltetrahydrofolate--homocysteine methyltransferase